MCRFRKWDLYLATPTLYTLFYEILIFYLNSLIQKTITYFCLDFEIYWEGWKVCCKLQWTKNYTKYPLTTCIAHLSSHFILYINFFIWKQQNKNHTKEGFFPLPHLLTTPKNSSFLLFHSFQTKIYLKKY